LLTMINKHVVLPMYFRKSNNHVLSRLNELEKSQYFPVDKINTIQFVNLKRLLTHCYKNVPFYRQRFDSVGFNPGKFSDPGDIKRIPYLTKTDIQSNLQQLIAQNYDVNELVPDASGGSTGKPTNYYKDIYRHQIRRADQLRHDRWSGWDIGEKYATLWGAQREFENKTSLKAKILDRYVHRVYGFNAFDISEEKVLNYLDELKHIRPTMILAYANVAFLFAEIIHKHAVDLSALRLKGLISAAETLSSDKRKIIESAFSCNVFNRYGSREVGLIASECEARDGLHINSENVFVEIQNEFEDALTGEMGEVIVTDLWNYGMPFIRYQLGDVAVQSNRTCKCGRGLRMLQEVTGRVSDFIVDADGGLVHGEYFTHLFYGIEGIEQFQLIQESLDKITLKILPNRDFESSSLVPIIAKIKLCIGNDVQVEVVMCDKSLIEASGKYRFTVSKVKNTCYRA